MKRNRPYIPLAVRVEVAERQVRESGSVFWPLYLSEISICEKAKSPWGMGARLRVLMGELERSGPCQLDHDPALVLREFKIDRRKPPAAWYTPNANDPDFLIYRPDDQHQQKTTGRKPGASRTITTKGSDIGLKTKFARLERKRKIDTSDIPETKKGWFKKAKVKIPSRPFSTQKRKFR